MINFQFDVLIMLIFIEYFDVRVLPLYHLFVPLCLLRVRLCLLNGYALLTEWLGFKSFFPRETL